MRGITVTLCALAMCMLSSDTFMQPQAPLYLRLATGTCVQARYKMDVTLVSMYTDYDGSHIAVVTIEGYAPEEVDPQLQESIQGFVVLPGEAEEHPRAVFLLNLFMLAPGSGYYTIEAYGELAGVLYTEPGFRPPRDGTHASLVLM